MPIKLIKTGIIAHQTNTVRSEIVLSQIARNTPPDPMKYGLSRNHSYFVMAMEFLLTPNNTNAFARRQGNKTPIKQGNDFVFNGDESIEFEDADSTLHFFFPKDYAHAVANSITDFANRTSIKRIFYSQGGKNFMLVGVPWNWLNSSLQGDLIIDPTTNAATNEDVRLYDAGNYGSDTKLAVGKFPNAGQWKSRSIISFSLAGIPSNATVLNAQMKLKYYEKYNNSTGTWVDRWIQAQQMLVSWDEAQADSLKRLTGVNWGAARGKIGGTNPDANGSYESTTLFVEDETLPVWKTWDLTALTQKWVSGATPNYGVLLWATNENTSGYVLRFYSSEATNTSDRPYLEVVWSDKPRTVYFLKDHLGSIRATVLDSTGAPLVGFDDYDPWGYPLATRTKAIPNAHLQGASKNKFTGKESDDELGLNWVYLGARSYDPQIGRFPVVDRFSGKYPSLTPYQYAANNPMLFIDINGDSLFVNGSQVAVNAFINTSNNALGGFYTVSVGKNGLVTVAATNKQGPLTSQQQAFYKTLMNATNLATVDRISIGLVMNSNQVMVGSFSLSQIDMADVAKLDGPFSTAAGALGHELAEQFVKQTGKEFQETYKDAHQWAIESAENPINRSIRGFEFGGKNFDPTTLTGTITTPYTQGGITVHLIVTYNQANIINVARKIVNLEGK